MGGSNDTNNLVALTAREHFVCHLLLTRFTTDNHKKKMIYAAYHMCKQHGKNQKRYVPTSRIYESLKLQFSAIHAASLKGRRYEELYGEELAAIIKAKLSVPRGPASPETIEKRVAKLRGKKRTPQQIENIKLGQKNAPQKTDEEKRIYALKMSSIKKGVPLGPKSDDHKAKLSLANKGSNLGPKSEETKQKMRKPKSEAHRRAISEGRKAKYAAIRNQQNQYLKK